MINLNEERDKNLIQEIVELGGHDLLKCYQCGTCIADCPTGVAAEPLSVKRLIHMIKLGLRDKLLEDETPWMCVTCGGCEERCPREAEPFEIVLAVRRWQCREDETFIPTVLGEIYMRGHTQNIANAANLRKSLDLPELPPTVISKPEWLERFQKMLREMEFVKEYGFMFGIDVEE
ncbi:Heterodisulfide reductase, subunit C [Archaeoglobus sulfaticallidus PM70-1]|uniref:Heterodisulfide reductase, subunit C n=1 Tax=Archaeoglobus sulfaticallidus PM70-1 TaxID=387631 RepID=N0BHK2_9EURY|nr:4Fe-4S dicluster domain-containing protein [Archaeoglobus sulfaticallidus]AGK61792.1 Heterodisulfide reductase, subunit C [Archaeoglobus sulfaticallidus PM70-1]